ncbi:MAG TPA: O-antigen ligase family protein, partial [Pyrinomonadaceae bacterium]
MTAVNQTGAFTFYLQKIVWFFFLALVFSLALMQPLVFFGGRRLSPTDFIFPILVLLWLASLLTLRKRLRWDNFYWILLFYFASMTFSAIFSINPPGSFIKLLGELYLLGLAVLTFNLVETETQFRQTIKIWLIGTFIACAVGIYSLILFYVQPGNPFLNYTTYHYGAVPVGNYPRLSSSFVSASMFCNYLNVSFLLILIARKTNFIKQYSAVVLLTLVLLCAIFTISAGLGGFTLAFGLWFWVIFREKQKRLAFFCLFGGILASTLFFLMNFVALQKHSTARFSIKIPLLDTEIQPSPRVLIWQESLQTFSRNFFSGVGLGEDVCRVSFQNTEGTTSILTDAHNYLLNVAAQNGIFGLAAIIAVTIFIFRLALPFRLKKSASSIILAGLTTAFICS